MGADGRRRLTCCMQAIRNHHAPVMGRLTARSHRIPRVVASLGELTTREREVLALMAEGYSNQGICERLFLSTKTVETHVRSIFMRLGLTDEPEDNRRVLAAVSYIASAPAGLSLAA